jgi:hypothetical protein
MVDLDSWLGQLNLESSVSAANSSTIAGIVDGEEKRGARDR